MRIQCPKCSQRMEVPETAAGQVVACPACAQQMQVPAELAAAAEAAGSAAAGGAEPIKRCPFCGETILKVARKCKHCQETLPEGVDADSVRARLAAKEKKIAGQLASGGMPAVRRPSLRILTLVTAGAALVVLVLTVLAFSAKGDTAVMFGVLGVVALIILGIGVLVAFANDMQMLFYSKRNSPEKGLKAFLHSIRMGRYACAYACLLDGDKDELERYRRAIPSVSVPEGRFSLATLEGFRSYWKGLTRPGGAYMRRAVLSDFAVVGTVGEYARVKVSVKIEAYPWPLLLCLPLALLPVAIIIAVITKRETLTTTKLLRRVNGQWWVVNGELDSAEDRALEAALGAATVTAPTRG